MDFFADIGNQYLKWRSGSQCGKFASASGSIVVSMDAALGDLERPEACFVASVAAKSSTAAVAEWIRRNWEIEAVFAKVEPDRFGVRSAGYDLTGLGVDRWLALLAARAITEGPAIVVDCGTAITVDALTAKGQFVGGSILIGFHTASKALSDGAFALPELENFEAKLPARSTLEALSSGAVLGLVGGIERLVSEYLQFIGSPARLFLTGGDADLVKAYTSLEFERVPDLVLRGLALTVHRA